jgi:UPF0755 protein
MKRIAWLALLAAIGLACSAAYAWRWLHQPVVTQSAGNYEVPRGASVMRIAQDLQKNGWLQHPRIWSWWARSQGLSGKLKAGEYPLTPGMTPDAMLRLFTSGAVILHSLTIVEGTTFADLRRLLAQRDDIQHTLTNTADAELMRKLNLPDTHPEGQFFPDTYQFAKNSSDLEILHMAQQRMQSELARAWQQRAADLLLSSPYEALILASIIEKETAKTSERPMIAGVFMERLARGMLLQTDPTVIYGLGDSYDGNLRKADLLRDGPYNTYTRTGLPPTPIALAGAAALQAAVNPERTGAIFFVASGKGDGSHYFSRNLKEHNAAVRRYLATLRAN